MEMNEQSSIAVEIEKLFFKILKRHARKSDILYYLNKIISNEIKIYELPSILKNSEEYSNLLKLKTEIQKAPILTIHKFKINLDPEDFGVSRIIFKEKDWQPFETMIIKILIPNFPKIFDIGAHVGFYSLLCAMNNNSVVHSFEPSPDSFSLLESNVKINNFENVFVNKLAVSDFSGPIDFFLSDEHDTGSNRIFSDDVMNINEKRKKIQVTSTTIDDYIEKTSFFPDIIKMDIQGGEMKALQGMEKFLFKKEKLIIITEFWPKGLTSSGVSPLNFLKKLKDLDFVIFVIDEFNKTLSPEKSMEKIVNDFTDELNPEKQTDLLCLKNIDLPEDLTKFVK